MDLPNILNNRGHAQANGQLHQQFAEGRVMAGPGIDGAMQHDPAHAAKYASDPGQPLQAMSNMAHAQRFPNHIQQNMMPVGYPQSTNSLENGYEHTSTHENQSIATHSPAESGQMESKTQTKAFACQTCRKGFARRSDLARHGKDWRDRRARCSS